MSDLQFKRIDDAEEFLKSQGFWLVANTCDWTNIDGDDAGVYSIDGYWGEVKAWRVEINRRAAETKGERLSRRLMLTGLAVLPAALPSAAAAPADPIFGVIDRHRGLSAHFTEAVDVSAKLGDNSDFEAADAIAEKRSQALLDHSDVLIRSEPTTMLGALALMRYVASLEEWQAPADRREPWEIEESLTAAWHQIFLRRLADALDNISVRG